MDSGGRVSAGRPAHIGDLVEVVEGLHRGRRGRVVDILPASGYYARVKLAEGVRTVAIPALCHVEGGRLTAPASASPPEDAGRVTGPRSRPDEAGVGPL
ncbi:MAG: KOW motif-containing protein [Actinomycetota bacterium]